MIEALALLTMPMVVAAALAGLFRLLHSTWSRRRLLLAAAAPLPILVAALAVFLIVSAATSSEAKCGVDACGMATVFALFIMLYAVAAFLLGAIAAAAVLRDRRSA